MIYIMHIGTSDILCTYVGTRIKSQKREEISFVKIRQTGGGCTERGGQSVQRETEREREWMWESVHYTGSKTVGDRERAHGQQRERDSFKARVRERERIQKRNMEKEIEKYKEREGQREKELKASKEKERVSQEE